MKKVGFVFLNILVAALVVSVFLLIVFLDLDTLGGAKATAETAEEGTEPVEDIQTPKPLDEITPQETQDDSDAEDTPSQTPQAEEEQSEYQYYYLDENRLSSEELGLLFDSVVNYETTVVFNNTSSDIIDTLINDLLDIIGDTHFANVLTGISYQISSGTAELSLQYDAQRLEDLKSSLARARQVADEIFTDSMSQVEIAKTAHDYIVVNTSYDSEAYEHALKNPDDMEYPHAYSAYGVFFDNTAVCMGYTFAFNSLLNCEGIETRVLNSDRLNHSWSMAEISGAWYHCDVTFDDPAPDIGGLIQYTYFLKNDKYMQDVDINRILIDAQRSAGGNYYYDIYNMQLYSTPDGDLGYVLSDDALCTYSIESGAVNQNTRMVVIQDISSWFGLGADNTIIYTQQSDGDIYAANFDGSDKKLLMAADGLYIIDCKVENGKYILTCTEGLDGEQQQIEVAK